MVLLLRLFLSQKADITKKKQFEELAKLRRHFFASSPDDIKVYFTRWPWKVLALGRVP